jgi:formylglycine-generating enzyme required for sulfatase activity
MNKFKFSYIIASISILFLTSLNAQNNTDMVVVNGGTFTMGSKSENASAEDDEKKEHSVTLNSFKISKFEVTVWQWNEYLKANKLKPNKKPNWGWNDNYPINNITWNEAISYCNWLSKKEKLQPAYFKKGPNYVCDFNANGYRLPTEAEWEFAANGGKLSKQYKYSGNNNAEKVAWYKQNSKNSPHIIGTKSPNELGIYDMSGNVWEWCNDWYSESYYDVSPNNNPTGPEMGQKKVVRGGSWDSELNYLRPSNRICTIPTETHEFYGFRIAQTIK